MSLKRKLFILILGVVMVLSLALVMTGCGSSSGGTDTGTNTNTNTNTNNPSESGYTITILDSSDETVATVTLTDGEDNDISSIDTTKTGYKFLGFYTADGIQIFDAKGKQASGIIIDHEYTLYLRYSVKTYTFVYYVYNDDSKSYEVYKEQSYEYDTEIVNFENAPSKTGQDFVGWAKSSSGNSLYSSGTTPTNSVFNSTNYTISSDEVKLYAKYQAKKMTVTLVYNNASLNKSDVTFEVDYGSTLPDLSKYSVDCDGYELVGWSKYSYQYTEYTSTITTSIALYGYWREYKYISLVYSSTESVAYKVYNISGESCMLPEDATIPGYTLEGWYTNKNYTGNPVTGSQYNLLADTYYAKWNIVTYTITFEYDGEDFDDITYTVESDAITLPDIEIYGYNFYGWCTNSSLSGTPITKFVPSTSKGGYGDITLYPKLEKYSSTINYYLNSSKLGSITVEYGENYSIPVSSSKFGTGTDKEFKYWYMEDDDGKIVILTDDDGNSLAKWNYLESNYYVYAEYEQLYSVTLKYTNPSTGKTVSSSYGYFHVGDELTINAESFSNYGVTGYYINDTLVSSADYFTYTVEASNVTIIAEYSYKIAKEFATEYGFPYTVYCYNGHYYAIIESSKTWSNAEKWCEFYGGHLVTLTSSGENSFVGSILTDFASSSKYWIGANDVSVEGTWVWVTGEKWSYTNWSSNQPDNATNQDYAAMYVADSSWDDDGNASSSTSFPFIIEWDSLDSYITTVTETLTDVNGDEVTLTLYKYNNHYYAVVDNSMLWTVAEAYSEYIGGHLATITSSDENNFVSLLITNVGSGTAKYLIGGTDNESEGTWKWVTGETWSYTNWSSGNPVTDTTQQYTAMYVSDYKWDDIYTTTSYPFVIEWESLSDVGTIKQLYEIKYISTASEFLEIQNNTAGYYILESDIKLTTAWTPVDFSGYLIGNGHTVSGITVETSGNAGVFLTVTGTIENITFEVTVNSTSTSKVYVGGAVAQLNGGTLKNITVKGTVSSISGNAYTGGVVGIYSTGTISGLTNYAAVTSGTTTNDVGAGGVIGHADSYDFTDLTNYGNVTSYGEVGGIIGFMHLFYNGGTTAVMSGLKNYGILTSYSSCSCGGIFGDIKGSVNSSSAYSFTLSDCYNYGSVTTDSCNAGGIIGYMSLANSGSGVFTFAGYNLYNEGNVTSSGYYVGGLVGRGEAKTNTSYISGTSSAKVSGQYYVGGVAGYLSNITLKDSSNAGSTVTATSYFTSNSTNYVYLGGYVGRGYSVSGCNNAINISYKLSDSVYYIGGIAGYLTGTVNNCSNSGNILGARSVGGIVGYFAPSPNVTVSDLTNTGSVSGVLQAGGIIGLFYYSGSVSSLVTVNVSNLKNSGDITASSYNAGGIAGRFYLENTNSSYSYILYATDLENTGNVTGGYNVGGIVGYGYAESNSSYITESSSSGAITGTYYVGGLAGYLVNISLTDSSNAGSTVTATSFYTTNSTNYVYLGGYVGYGYCVSGLSNAVDITYNYAAKGIAGIAGYLKGTFSDCSNSGNITAINGYCVGGICGQATDVYTGLISGNTNTGTIKGYQYIGGVIGVISTSVSYNGDYTLEFSDLVNEGNVTGTNYDVGGIIGYINVSNTASNKNIVLHMSGLKNSGSVTGSYHVGGVLGYAVSDHSSSYITSSSSSGAVTGTYYVGGIAGYLSYISLTDSTNAGSTVTATSYDSNTCVYLGGYVGNGYCVSGCDNAVNISYSYAAQYIGGIAGYLTGTISNCSNSGNITAAKASRMGGIVGRLTYAVSGVVTMSNLTNTGNITGADYVGGIFGRLYYNTSASYNTTLSLSAVSNSGKITVSGSYAGGIAGHVYLKNTHNSYTYSMYASDLTNTGAITAANYCYGIFGYGEIEASSSVTSYVSTGSINCSGSYYGKTYTGSNITFQ